MLLADAVKHESLNCSTIDAFRPKICCHIATGTQHLYKGVSFSVHLTGDSHPAVLFYDIKITKRGRKIQTLSRYCISLSRPLKKASFFLTVILPFLIKSDAYKPVSELSRCALERLTCPRSIIT